MLPPKILLTGAHLTPALALQAELEKHHFPVEFLSLNSPKFNRHEPFKSIFSFLKLPYYVILAWQKINRLRPAVVVSFGGYSALPVCLAAKINRLPLLIHEQTFGAGITSRITAVLAAKVAVSWPASLAYFPRHKTVLTGNPIRQELLHLKPAAGTTPKSIYITGGHQGSLVINQAIAPLIPGLVKHYRVYHQFGLAQKPEFWPKFKAKRYLVKPWFEAKELAQILAQNCLVISRSGINIVTELAWLNRRAILIPLATAQKNEQLANASFLQSLGLALILPQSNLSPDSLLAAINLAGKTLPAPAQFKLDLKLISEASTNLFRLVKQLAYEAEN